MQAIALRGGRIRPRIVVAKVIASALCIGSGGSAGREGPIVQVGAALGSTVVLLGGVSFSLPTGGRGAAERHRARLRSWRTAARRSTPSRRGDARSQQGARRIPGRGPFARFPSSGQD